MIDHAEAERRARERVLPYAADYFAATSAGASVDAQIADWEAFRFAPHILRGAYEVDLTTTALGTPLRTPVMIAPMAQQIAAHPEGEAAMARAVAATGSLLGVSTNTAIDFADIGATGAPWWFQVYVTRDHALTELMVARARAAGARALMFTVDMVRVLPSTVNPRLWPEGAASRRLANLTDAEIAAAGPRATDGDPAISFDTIGWLAEISGLPVLVKGVLRADDALATVAAGAAGVVVSTHGGRRFGSSISSARALRTVVEAVDGRAEVYVDSGLRTAAHVAAALALGARGVFLGRPALWALAAYGPDGVQALIHELSRELADLLAALGVRSLNELDVDLIG
jgi:4-hydroxymandelate oxidase